MCRLYRHLSQSYKAHIWIGGIHLPLFSSLPMPGSRRRNHSQREPLRKGRAQGQGIAPLCCHHLWNITDADQAVVLCGFPSPTNHSWLKGNSDSCQLFWLLPVFRSTVSTASIFHWTQWWGGVEEGGNEYEWGCICFDLNPYIFFSFQKYKRPLTWPFIWLADC